MYIRRKVFSIIEDENGEERLFSTTEFVNEEDYLQREFGEKSLSLKDKAQIIGDKLLTKKEVEFYSKLSDPNVSEEEKQEVIKKTARKSGNLLGLPGGIIGGANIGATAGMMPVIMKGKNPNFKLIGGAAAVGAGVGAVAGKKIKERQVKKYLNKYKDTSSEKDQDFLKYRRGEISKDELISKYGK